MTGSELLAGGAWSEARHAFEAALTERESAEALEGLGLAAWWLDDGEAVFESRERAYKLYLDTDDKRSAARIAVWLAWDCLAFRGESAVASGWLQRARRLLEGLPESTELAWLEARESQLALAEEGDPDRAHRHATEAIRVARAVKSIRLFLSEHTVHRHVANILNKLSVSSRAAAVAQAARRGLLS